MSHPNPSQEWDNLQNRVVAEQEKLREPAPPKKQIILGTFVVESKLPDGYHWFGGFRNHPAAEAAGMTLVMNVWSPYLEDAEFFPTREMAEGCANFMPECECYVKPVEGAMLTEKEHPYDPNIIVSRPVEELPGPELSDEAFREKVKEWQNQKNNS